MIHQFKFTATEELRDQFPEIRMTWNDETNALDIDVREKTLPTLTVNEVVGLRFALNRLAEQGEGNADHSGEAEGSRAEQARSPLPPP